MDARAMNPVILHVIRPYETVEEYLSAEAWTIEARAVLLLGTREVAPETPVVFDLGIATGDKLMRAEGRVAAFFPATDEHPSVLRVRYRRYGSQTKAFIERAVSVREEQLAREALSASNPPPPDEPAALETPRSAEHHAPAAPPADGAPEPHLAAQPEVAQSEPTAPLPKLHAPAASGGQRALASVPAAPAAPAASAPGGPSLKSTARVQEPSGIHRRPVVPVHAPPNRDELLARLRARVSGAPAASRTKTGAD